MNKKRFVTISEGGEEGAQCHCPRRRTGFGVRVQLEAECRRENKKQGDGPRWVTGNYFGGPAHWVGVTQPLWEASMPVA